ncbi:ATP-dependent RNA helicase RhlE [Vibrio chagasii]|uniref:DEAD/DEAH box helicase n=1 Tax=Vibrio TaxID=662 RepID=UPI000FE31A00|nr:MULTISPECIES: DEAD/DEAH box helicase [unclassified Vibrio]CAH6810686.1 ATP-dependent RNA helicase RhlE [Vibrio chagasii]MCG9552783.1 DEAD/DEAH box helicase [Vibrio sp. Isolate32]MCG9601756.1 DEAD/DEAH box helicase [Vibrio sp. Isolate31]MCG9692994.1 DEAD/DEAH box helicase [Vibrio sp. Isolate22]CAH6829360.1 ATP-dependent RNA helicase RhlE [Vibrio chagasii]|eukprot:TRINITY_DN3197_c0_g1_i4.p1 TRINITY_DN3197_c0_g1~~TRINITY_DN3197_c0_g1_i4.p1  ORF type:complete len:402 (+),score=47.35 TRINITY_DN3197_c0_g1_i4:171-1376(+)
MPFSKLGLSSPIVKAVAKQGYEKPTSIQEKAIPIVLSGKNLIAAAQTGTGKTASFVLPILEMLSKGETQRKKRIRAVILTPTRELAVQVEQNIKKYAKFLNLTSLAMYGGVSYQHQKDRLIEGVDILVATPGRLIDMYGQRAVHFDEVEVLVLDEADRMLDMGFIEDINKIIARLPQDVQNLLFSATLSTPVRALAKSAISDAEEISIAKTDASKANIEQWLVTVDKDRKSALLSHMITEGNWDQALIFIETKHGAAKLVSQLEKRGIHAEAFHSGRSQAIREKILADFKKGHLKFLVATGVAARGIDIDNLPRVVNYDMPFPADDYVHRIGRTGRADATGEAISFLSKDNFKNLCIIEKRLGHLIERRVVEGFEPRKEVPISVLNFVPKKKREQQAKEGK